MEVITKDKIFKLTHPLLISFKKRVEDVDELRKEMNGLIGSSEFWIDDVERVRYEDDSENILQFSFRITRVLPADPSTLKYNVDQTQMLYSMSVEIEKTLLLALTKGGYE